MNLKQWIGLGMAAAAVALLGACTSDPAMSLKKAEFVGSEKCGACHTDEYKTWKDTYHNKMVRSTRDGLLKDARDNWAKDSKGNAGPTKANITGTPARLEDVEYVIGSKWKQRFLVKNPNTGNHQFLDKQWNRVSNAWEGYGQKNDWETQCATCHATGYRITSYDPKNTAAMKTTMSEHNTGCEACHGPGSTHVQSHKKADIFNPKNASKAEADKVCGYCHLRGENDQWLTAQGNHSEHLPHPVLGESYKAGQDDWTKWYPSKVLLPGIQADDPINRNYPNTDLNNAFFIDDAAQKSGYFEARKHHQQYQEHLQSKHAKAGLLACQDCHSSHAVKGKTINAAETCKGCHGATMDFKKVMPGTAQTAGGLFVRTHTFNPNPRPSGATADTLPAPVYAFPK
ncbi:MAG: hypothetical protein IPO82_04850 [Betaproteobacteria bacterium]|nr:hypothetical protein [Betaproteobacteria bacterium]MBK7592359.1 hypothetical protein [Betaproteobacteria bacterium]MBK7742244.1 hypothetical protein [Betaproteobacteria bacterium]MBK9674585.1 hypothetical protein [Betaproteobacteria bacterium]